jgi:hypothetical protein
VNTLVVSPNIADMDRFYAKLLALHEGRTEAESAALNARLLLLLANHIGDQDIIENAMAKAAAAVSPNT